MLTTLNKFRNALLFAGTLGLCGNAAAVSFSTEFVNVTVSGQAYQVRYFTLPGNTSLNSSPYSNFLNTNDMPWWGNETSARAFATAVQYNPGDMNHNPLPGTDKAGLLFAYSFGGPGFQAAHWIENEPTGYIPFATTSTIPFGIPPELRLAVLQAVPEIDGALLPQAALLAAGSLIWMRRRKEPASSKANMQAQLA
jgi:hypothetical protein